MTARATVGAYVALLVLAAVTLGLSFVPLGSAEAPVALGIAALKALVVAAVFMHLAARPFGFKLVLGVAVGTLLLLTGFATADVMTRGTPPAVAPDVVR